jgi:hypothetical protein
VSLDWEDCLNGDAELAILSRAIELIWKCYSENCSLGSQRLGRIAILSERAEGSSGSKNFDA